MLISTLYRCKLTQGVLSDLILVPSGDGCWRDVLLMHPGAELSGAGVCACSVSDDGMAHQEILYFYGMRFASTLLVLRHLMVYQQRLQYYLAPS